MRSTAEQDQASPDSVFDFLYVDFDRVSSFLSQLNDNGNLKEVVRSNSAGRGSAKFDKQSIGGGILVAKGDAEIGSNASSQHDSSKQQIFDSRWINPLLFLDEVSSRGMLQRDFNFARIGQLALATGPLQIRDLGTMRDIWKKPAFKSFTERGMLSQNVPNRQERRSSGSTSTKVSNKQPTKFDLMFELIEILPHTLQAIFGGDKKVWCILRDEFLSGDSTDFALKYGGFIPGDWTVLGVLDAYPNESPLAAGVTPNVQLNEIYDVLAGHINPIARQMVGRPANAFGMTPIMIFRSIGQSQEN